MPLYVDIHEVHGTTPEAVAQAHLADLAKQDKHHVKCIKYWLNESRGKIFCLIDAPSAEAADLTHREAHGLLAEKIIEVDPELVEGFLGGGAINAHGAVLIPGGEQNDRDTAIRTVLFTDIVGSTAMTQSLGDDAAFAVLQIHDTVVRRALAEFGGREIKHTGDGIMACFLSAVSATRCATRIQQDISGWQGGQHDMKLRIGAAAGEPVEHNQDLFGTTVQLAARLCAHAAPDEILITHGVAELCLGKGLSFVEVGERQFKGFDRPFRVHAVVWR